MNHRISVNISDLFIMRASAAFVNEHPDQYRCAIDPNHKVMKPFMAGFGTVMICPDCGNNRTIPINVIEWYINEYLTRMNDV